MSDIEDHADQLLREVHRALEYEDTGMFSVQAFRALKLKISLYVRSLITESARIARRRKSDMISVAHVDEASDHLTTSTSRRWLRHTGTVGGILLGAGLSSFLSMTTANQYTPAGVVVSAALGVGGAFAVALHIGLD